MTLWRRGAAIGLIALVVAFACWFQRCYRIQRSWRLKQTVEGDIEIEVHLKTDKPKAPPPKAKPTGEPRLPKDARVLIHGLVSDAGKDLNGLDGRVAMFHEAKERYDVRLADGRVVSCRLANLIDLGQHQI